MKKMKRFLCVLLAGAALLAGCASGSGGSKDTEQEAPPMGRYVESEATPQAAHPEAGKKAPYSLGIYPDVNGALYYLATVSGASRAEAESVIFCRSSDGGDTWETLPAKWYDLLIERYGWEGRSLLKNIAFDSNGTLYCLVCVENNWYKVAKVKDDTIEEIPLEGWDQQEFYDALQGFTIQSFQVLPNNDIAVSFNFPDQYSFVYDGSSGKLKEKLETQDAAVFLGNDGYAKLCYDSALQGNALVSLDYSGVEKSKHPVETLFADEVHLCGGTGNLYMIDETGVYSFPENASEGSLIMEPDFYTFGSPSWYVKQFTYDDSSEAFYAILKNHDSGDEKLFRYTFDTSVPSHASEKLKVFALQDNDTLRQAISVYQRSHPELKVELEIGLPVDSAVTKDDVVRVLNTELLAKKGPDVIILDGLPVQTYVEKGVLADLSELANSGGLFPNIAKAYTAGDGIYAIPARCSIPVMCGEKALVESLTSLPGIAEQAKKSPPLPEQVPLSREDRLPKEERPLAFVNAYWDTIKLFYSTYSPKLIEENKSVNTGLLSELLAQSKALFNQFNVLNGDDYLGDGLTGDILSFGARDVYGERTLLGITVLKDFNDCFRYSRSAPQKNDEDFKSAELFFTPLCGPEKHVFIPGCIASVNVSSQKIDCAKQFVQTLLSEDVQTPAYSDGFPINKASFKACYEESKTRWSVDYRMDMEQLIASLSTPATIDETILGAILDEVKPYYKDEETLDEAIEHISAKLRTYLAEKS